ncbi:tail protein X [Paenibacillus sp. GbtcB18]|uniref:tail protein X n=1 Tax=Paenibacillus sp. GbtcB18 TaxID=2824763 RepID=UPI001C2FCF4B|nr:tail protein X [Paenibacillus sp. GbtcB18]
MIYTTIQGDTWDGLSYQFYGSERFMPLLLNFNEKHANIVVFPAGITLEIPPKPAQSSDTLPPWKRRDPV